MITEGLNININDIEDDEHKVYVDKSGKVKECMDLRDYLAESFK